jgi:hypothetical protein
VVTATVITIALSAFVFPVVWLVSVILLWRSRHWTHAQKWVGTLLGLSVGAIAGAISVVLLAETLGVPAGHPLVVWNSIAIALLAMTLASVIVAFTLVRSPRATVANGFAARIGDRL